jgi:hypothetical protein
MHMCNQPNIAQPILPMPSEAHHARHCVTASCTTLCTSRNIPHCASRRAKQSKTMQCLRYKFAFAGFMHNCLACNRLMYVRLRGGICSANLPCNQLPRQWLPRAATAMHFSQFLPRGVYPLLGNTQAQGMHVPGPLGPAIADCTACTPSGFDKAFLGKVRPVTLVLRGAV